MYKRQALERLERLPALLSILGKTVLYVQDAVFGRRILKAFSIVHLEFLSGAYMRGTFQR